MKDDRRLRIMKALTSTLEAINPADGVYQHDMAGKVFRGRFYYGDGDPLPMLSILEGDPPADREVSNAHQGSMQVADLHLNIQGFLVDDMHNPSDPAHRLLADVKRALAMENHYEPGRRQEILNTPYIHDLEIGFGAVRPADGEVSSTGFFILPITIRYTENLENPFD